MLTISNVNLVLDKKRVLSRQAIGKNSRLTPQIELIVHELLAVVKSSQLLRPSISYKIYPIVEIGDDFVRLENNATLHGSLFRSILSEARELALVVYTLGPGLEKMVTQYFQKGDPLQGTLLDAIGSEAMDLLGEKVCEYIRNDAASRGFQSSNRFDPGTHGLPLSEQKRIFEMVPTREIGASLTDSGMIIPLKSITTVIGIGPQMPTWSQAETCSRCASGRTCPDRKIT